MSKKKMKSKYIMLLSFLLFGNIFLFPHTLRSYFFGTNVAYLNLFWLVGFSFVILNVFGVFEKIYKKKELFYIITYLLLVFLIYFIFGRYVSLSDMIKRFFSMCLPIMIIFMKFKRKDDLKLFFLYTVNFINIAAIFIVFCGFIDLLGDKFISGIFLKLYSEYTSLPKQYDMNRIISYYGHPLYTSEIMLIYLVMNEVKARFFLKQSSIIFHYFICILGLAFASSKAAFICFFLYTFIINFSKIKRLIPIILLTVFGYRQGFFSIILGRFQRDIEAGNLSSNRNSSISKLVNNGLLEFNLFRGTSISIPNDPIFLAALEYPPLQFAYTHGFIYVILMYLSLVLYPLNFFLKLKKEKNFFILSLLFVFIYINTFNGFSTGRDSFMLYVTYVFLLINISMIADIGGTQ